MVKEERRKIKNEKEQFRQRGEVIGDIATIVFERTFFSFCAMIL